MTHPTATTHACFLSSPPGAASRRHRSLLCTPILGPPRLQQTLLWCACAAGEMSKVSRVRARARAARIGRDLVSFCRPCPYVCAKLVAFPEARILLWNPRMIRFAFLCFCSCVPACPASAVHCSAHHRIEEYNRSVSSHSWFLDAENRGEAAPAGQQGQAEGHEGCLGAHRYGTVAA